MTLHKIASVFVAVLLLAACESTGEGGGSTAGSGEGGTGVVNYQSWNGPNGVMARFGDRVFFDTDKSDLNPAARTTIEAWANYLKANGSQTMTIQGHCDERGTREYNLALGDRRATAVKNYLVALGIAPNRIQTISYGKERPDDPGHTEAAWAKNRRAVAVPSAPTS
jgi:peptidoglycan-associated lipoprotein